MSEKENVRRIKPKRVAGHVNPVRCAECKYFEDNDLYTACRWWWHPVYNPDDYCSYGERRKPCHGEDD